MTEKGIRDFLRLLVMFGHDGDLMCLATIEKWLRVSVTHAVKQYHRYLSTTEVKLLKPKDISALIKEGALVWTVEGLITPNPGNKLPLMNGKILMHSDMEKLSKFSVIVVKTLPQ